jgi:hypothetical protein
VEFTAAGGKTLYATRVTDVNGNSITIDYADKRMSDARAGHGR